MADNTRNDNDDSSKTKRSTKTRDRRDAAKSAPKRTTAKRDNDKRDRKRADKRREGGARFELDANTKKLILGAAAVAGAGAAGALFAAWRKHADGLFDFSGDDGDQLIKGQDIDSLSGQTGLGTADNTGGTATGGSRAAKSGSGRRSTAKTSRDTIDDDKRDAFAPATVPLSAATADA